MDVRTGMIDIHAHLLPEFDDGPETLDESLKTARAYVDAGYTMVVATPHVIPGLYEHSRVEILNGVKALQERLEVARIPLAILPGAEYHLTNRLISLLQAGELVTLNDTGKYLLVELPVYEIPSCAPQVFFELLLAGITPILAHPERNDFLVRHPGTLGEMVRKGVMAQVTAGSLTGLFGPTSKRAANLFIKEGCAHIVATDAHGPGYRLEAGPAAAQLLGEKGRVFMCERPDTVIRGALLDIAACRDTASARSRRFRDFLSRG